MSVDHQFSFGLHVALQYMLEKQRTEIFKVICSCPGFTVSSVNMTRLYYRSSVQGDKYNLIKGDADLERRLAQHVSPVDDACMHACMRACTRTHARTHTHTHRHTHTQTGTHAHARTHMHTTRTNTRTHAYIRTGE